MNYTKYLSKTEKFRILFQDEKIKISMDVLKEIEKTKILINNFSRIGKTFLI